MQKLDNLQVEQFLAGARVKLEASEKQMCGVMQAARQKRDMWVKQRRSAPKANPLGTVSNVSSATGGIQAQGSATAIHDGVLVPRGHRSSLRRPRAT